MWLVSTGEVLTMSRKLIALRYLCSVTKLKRVKDVIKSKAATVD
jgi:hypothetical protein